MARAEVMIRSACGVLCWSDGNFGQFNAIVIQSYAVDFNGGNRINCAGLEVCINSVANTSNHGWTKGAMVAVPLMGKRHTLIMALRRNTYLDVVSAAGLRPRRFVGAIRKRFTAFGCRHGYRKYWYGCQFLHDYPLHQSHSTHCAMAVWQQGEAVGRGTFNTVNGGERRCDG